MIIILVHILFTLFTISNRFSDVCVCVCGKGGIAINLWLTLQIRVDNK